MKEAYKYIYFFHLSLSYYFFDVEDNNGYMKIDFARIKYMADRAKHSNPLE